MVKEEFIHLVFGVDGTSLPEEKVAEIANLFAQEAVKDLEISEYDPDLLITKGIIGLHNGQIRIDNRPGMSTRIIISLPVHQPSFDDDLV